MKVIWNKEDSTHSEISYDYYDKNSELILTIYGANIPPDIESRGCNVEIAEDIILIIVLLVKEEYLIVVDYND